MSGHVSGVSAQEALARCHQEIDRHGLIAMLGAAERGLLKAVAKIIEETKGRGNG